MTLDEFLALSPEERATRIAELTAEQLAELDQAIRDHATDLNEQPRSAETVQQLVGLADAVEAIDAEVQRRATEQAELDRQAQEAVARLTRPDAEAETPETPEVPAGDADAEAQPEAVAAAAPPQRPSLRAMTATRSPGSAPQPPAASGAIPVSLTAAADVAGFSAGQAITDRHRLAEALTDRINAVKGSKGGGELVPVATFRAEYPDELRLTGDEKQNARRISAVRDAVRDAGSVDAVVASGGICAPLPARYDLLVLSSTDRPVRDALPAFNAERGGVRFVAPPTVAALAAATTYWTAANDASPSAPATKAFFSVPCGSETTVTVNAIPVRLRFGNMGARAYPELVQANMDLSMAAGARVAEAKLLTAINAASTAVTTVKVLGAARDILSEVGLAAQAYRNRHRMGPTEPLRVIFPAFAREMIRADLARQLATDNSASDGGALAVADAEIESFFAVRHVNVTWAMETAAGAWSATQAGGALQVWPTTVVWNLFAEGSFLFLDGGTLDLGTVRDSTLNNTNDYEIFTEPFENVAFVGVEALKVTTTTAPDGSSAGTVSTSAYAGT